MEDANMTTQLSVDAKGMMAKHQEALIEYSRRVLLHGEFLNEDGQADLDSQMMEFMAIGISYKCTKRELVMLLYKGLFQGDRGCDCSSCKTRTSPDQPMLD